jgi:hypothetical protein
MNLLSQIFLPLARAQEVLGIEQPLRSDLNSIPKLINALLEIVYKIGLPVVVLYFLYAGWLYVSARGNPAKIKTAHEAFLYTVVGAALILGAFVISRLIIGTINSLGGPTVQ